jgi:hypothetical protein
MLPHAKRQIIYGAVFLLIFAAIGAVIFSYAQKIAFVSCVDGEQNGQETGVDCGGPDCIQCEFKNIHDLQAEWVKIFLVNLGESSNENNNYFLIAKITNPNEKIGAPSFEYFYNFYDSDNALVGNASGLSFISPLQSKLILVSFDNPALIKRAELKLSRNIDWQILEKPIYAGLDFSGIKFGQPENQNEGVFKAEAAFSNNSSFFLPEVTVNALVLDKDDKILSVNKTLIRNVGIGESANFEMIWFSPFSGEISRLYLEAEVNEFDVVR